MSQLGALHPWDLDVAASPCAPARAGRAGDLGSTAGPYETVGGADVSYNK